MMLQRGFSILCRKIRNEYSSSSTRWFFGPKSQPLVLSSSSSSSALLLFGNNQKTSTVKAAVAVAVVATMTGIVMATWSWYSVQEEEEKEQPPPSAFQKTDNTTTTTTINTQPRRRYDQGWNHHHHHHQQQKVGWKDLLLLYPTWRTIVTTKLDTTAAYNSHHEQSHDNNGNELNAFTKNQSNKNKDKDKEATDNEEFNDGDDRKESSSSSSSSNSTTTTSTNSNENMTVLLNWSGTHSMQVSNEYYWEPETIEEVERIVAHCHAKGIPLRPMGSALSPNGLAFWNTNNNNNNHDQETMGGSCSSTTTSGGILCLSNLDKIIQVDKQHQTVTVQAGARVSQVVEALRQYQLTLPNLASIAEQQMGGFIQVGAHGTGRTIAPVDHYVTKLTLVTPGLGTITLTRAKHGILFELVKVGLGCLGVVIEITIQCIPAHDLVEHTYCLSRQQAKEQVHTLLQQHKHVRFMWIPYTDTVVVVTNDPKDNLPPSVAQGLLLLHNNKKVVKKKFSQQERFQPLRQLLLELQQEQQQQEQQNINDHPDNTNQTNKDKTQTQTTTTTTTTTTTSTTTNTMSESIMIEGMGFGDLRDAILSYNPLDRNHVQRCNEAEAEFWKRSEGYQIKSSDELLQFDCGGQQWVWEVCFPTGTQEQSNGNDMKFMTNLLEGIEREGIPAHSPIEQRWSASSSSLMSPAHGLYNGLHSWVGIINYLPLAVTEKDEEQRREITKQFKGPYCDLMRSICSKYNGTSHWAKLELPANVWQLVDLQLFLEKRFPVQLFNQARAMLDPRNLMANDLINCVLGVPTTKTLATTSRKNDNEANGTRSRQAENSNSSRRLGNAIIESKKN